jgi:hypothetical protein
MVGILEAWIRTGELVSYYSTLSGMEVPCTVTRALDQDRILFFDQHREELYKSLSENARRPPARVRLN